MANRNKNKNKKNNNSKPRRARRRTGRKSTAMIVHPSAGLSQTAHKVCSITDPFCVQALGQRWPDGTSVRTVPYQVRFVLPMTTGANGNVGAVFYPGFVKYGGNFFQALTTTDFLGTMATFDPTNVKTSKISEAYFIPSDGQISQTRLVSHGIRWIPSVTPMLAKGNTVMCQGYPVDGFFQTAAFGMPTAWSSWKIGSIRDDSTTLMGYAAPAGPEARSFHPPEGFFADEVATTQFRVATRDWTPLFFAILGAEASSQVGFLEVVYNFELVYTLDSAMIAFAPRPSPANSVLTDASNHVMTVMDGVVKTTAAAAERAIVNKAVGFLEGAINRAGAFVGGYLTGGPIGAAVGSTAGTSIRGLLKNRGHVMEVD